MPNEERIDSLFNVQLIQAEQAKTLALLTEVKDKINKIGRVEIQLKGEKSIKGITDATRGLNAEQKELLKIQNDIQKTYAKRIALESDQAKILAEEKKLLQQRNQELKNSVREENAAIGSIERKRAALIRLQAAYDNASAAQRASPEGQNLQKATSLLTQELKNLEAETGRAQRNVGNYTGEIGKSEKVTKEAAKGNEVLATAVSKVEPNSEKATTGVNKFYGGLRRLANLIPGLGISGVLLVGFELLSTAASAAGNALGILSSKGYSAKKATEDINEEFAHTSSTVAEAKTRIEVLIARTKDAGLTFQQKQNILKNYNTEFGDTIGKAKNYNELERILVERAPVYIKILTLKAKAQAAANLQQKEFQKQLSGELETQDIASVILQGNSIKAITDIVKESTSKAEAYAKQQAQFEKEADDLKLQYHIKTEDDKTAKTIKSDKDRTAEILAEARKQAFELQKLRDEAALKDAQSIAENEVNNAEIRTNAAMDAFVLEKKIATDARDFEVAQNKATLAIELADKKNNASERKALQEKSNAESLVIEEKYRQSLLQAGQNFAKELGSIAKDNPGKLPGILPLPDAGEEYDEQMKLLKEFLSDTAKEIDKADKEELKKREEKLKLIEDLEKESVETIGAFIDAGFDRKKNQIQEEIDAIGVKKDKEIEAVQASTLSEQDKAAKLTQINIKAQADSEALQRRQRELDIKKAQFDKTVTIAKIVGETAFQIIKNGGFTPNAILIAAIGALQIARVLATPIPKFAKGTDNAPGGPAIVGEQGTEAIITPSGEVSLTPSTPTLANLERGSKVITADKVEQYLMNMAVRKIHIPKAKTEQGYAVEMTQALTAELRRLGGIIENKQEVSFHWDNGELRKSIKKANNIQTWINKYKD